MKVIIILVYYLVQVIGERTRDKMYESILGASCFRRLNGTHQIGCTSVFGGSVGVLHLIEKQDELDFILNNPPAPPYAPLMLPNLFTRENAMRLKNSQHISVLLLINNMTKPKSFSPESRCPNQYGMMMKEQTCNVNNEKDSWNPFGSNLLHEDFNFPIYYVHDPEEVKKLINCYKKFNMYNIEKQYERSLCSVKINSFMSAAVNSEVCMRRSQGWSGTRFCDPLQGKNVFATLYPREIVSATGPERHVNESEKFILVSTRLDTTSMFDGIGQGAMGSLVSMVTLISTAHLLSRLLTKNDDVHPRNVLFMLFNGEVYDFIGSQRFVYDMKNGDFPQKNNFRNPINISNIELMIDIGILDDISSIKVYHPFQFDLADKLIEHLSAYNEKFHLNVITTSKITLNMPPTSATSFLRENKTFPAVVLQSNPLNKYYHSLFDDHDNINFDYKNTSFDFTTLEDLTLVSTHFEADSIQNKIRNVSSILGFALYDIMTEDYKYSGSLGASSVLIDELLYCYLKSADCPLFRAASPPDSLPGTPLPLIRYVGVQSSFIQEATGWTIKILAYLVGQPQSNILKSDCNKLPLFWFSGFNGSGECIRTTQNFSKALSPAFEIDYNWNSGQYSTWTESTWQELSATMFLHPSKSHETFTLSIGIIVMILSFLFVYLINSKSDVLFGNSISSITEILPPTNC